MKEYNYEDIRKIISDIRNSVTLNNSNKLCSSSEELIDYLTECKKYIIPEKREEWCDLIRGIMYDVTSVIPPIIGSCANLTPQIARGIENHDNMLANVILMYVYVAEIMESYEEKGLDRAIDIFKSKELTDWARADVIYDVLRFSMFGPEFVEAVAPERIKKLKFKRTYDEIKEYLDKRNNLESRLVYAIKVKTTLEDYKKYCREYYCWECDNTEEKLASRTAELAAIGDDYLLTIVNNTIAFAKFLLQQMKEENNTYEGKLFTSISYQENDYINLGCTGGHFADELYQVECYGNTIWISDYILKNILDGISLSQDYDIEERIDGDVGCMYTYPKLNFNMKLSIFNKYYGEFFENKKRIINL